MYAIVGNGKGEWVQVANLREWTGTGSRSIRDELTGKVYGKGKRAWDAAAADMRTLNGSIRRPLEA